MNIYKDRRLFPYMSGDMLGNSKHTVTIAGVDSVVIESERGKEDKTVIRFKETDAPMILNKTNARAVARLYGPETNDWIGKRIGLEARDVKAFGAVHRAIRVINPMPWSSDKPAKGKGKAAAQPSEEDQAQPPGDDQAGS